MNKSPNEGKKMRSYLLFIFFTCYTGYGLPAFAEQSIFQNEWNHSSGDPIEEIAIMGTQKSGTVYIHALVKKNFPNCKVSSYKYGHKHCFPWVNLTKFQITKKKNSQDSSFNPVRKCLYLYVTKNAYENLKLHYVEDVSKNDSFLDWVSKPWIPIGFNKFTEETWNPYDDRVFNNALELRKYKTLNFLQIGSLAANFVFVRYEDLIQAPEEFIKNIAENFCIQRATPFQKVSLDKLNFLRNLIHNKHVSFSKQDMDYITQNLDWEVERLIGYEKANTLN